MEFRMPWDPVPAEIPRAVPDTSPASKHRGRRPAQPGGRQQRRTTRGSRRPQVQFEPRAIEMPAVAGRGNCLAGR